MNKILVVVDMQNDFIDGSLGTPEAQSIIGNVVSITKDFSGTVIFTRDTHTEDYLHSQEGKYLPVEHCIKGTKGWDITSKLEAFTHNAFIIDKPTFGSIELVKHLLHIHKEEPISEITLIGLCTDICVVTNALLIKTALPEVLVKVVADACAGVTVEKHLAALETMRSCQVDVI